MTKLSVNLNAVAYLRNRRSVPWPSVAGIGRLVLEAGADGLTIHPRPDERHIRRSDVPELGAVVRDFPGAEFNIEGYPDEAFLDLVEAAMPDQVTFVPDDPGQATSDHGWDPDAERAVLEPAITRMKGRGIRVALFIDAAPSFARGAKALGADRVELFTGPYGGALEPAAAKIALDALVETADAATAAGLDINAGHDLTVLNLPALQTRVPGIAEVSIGHGITAEALLVGFPEAVRRYKAALA